MCIDPSQSWLAIGTDNGVHICWDLRFRLPVASVNHPGGARVLRLLCHPTQPSCLISAVNHNNEISIWDWENQSRTLALWASPTPPLSSYQVWFTVIVSLRCRLLVNIHFYHRGRAIIPTGLSSVVALVATTSHSFCQVDPIWGCATGISLILSSRRS
jgi:WD40 repeat protein